MRGSLLAYAFALAACMPALALAQQRTPAPADPAAKRPMSFRIVTNDPDAPPANQRRWVTATGTLTPDTPQVFDWFLRGNDISGLTIYFDSAGGSIVGGIRLGDALRKANARVAIGRSTLIGPEPKKDDERLPRHQLLPGRGVCYSSCAYAFLGGKQRLIAPAAAYGVHMFWPGDQMEGILSRKYAYAEIERAQRISANLAVYMQRVGADATLLQLAAATPPKGAIRRLSPREILQYRVATLDLSEPAFAGDGRWALALDQKDARISGDGRTRTAQGIDIQYTLEIACSSTPGFVHARFEMAPRANTELNNPLAFTRALLTAGDKSAVLAFSGKDIVARPATFPRRISRSPTNWIGAAGTIPADVLAEAVSEKRGRNAPPLVMQLEDGETTFTAPFGTGNLRETYEDWAKACARIEKSGNSMP